MDWNDILVRTVSTVVECLLASISATTMINQLDWQIVFYTTITAGLVTFLKCVLVEINKLSKDSK